MGEVPAFIYWMVEGAVRMSRTDSKGWTHRGRWVLGTFEVHLDRPSPRDAVALSDFHALKLDAGLWLDLLEDSFSLGREAVLNSAATVARLEERIPESRRSRSSTVAGTGVGRPLASLRPLEIVERIAFMTDSRMLSGAGVQTLADLAAVSREITFAAGEVTLPRGVDRQYLQVVVDGAIHAEREDPLVSRDYEPADVVLGAASFGRRLARGKQQPWCRRVCSRFRSKRGSISWRITST
jgi:CRP-like cAMP-binding protein